MRIGMFDSGIGGLTVLKQFIKHQPNNEYIYFGDTLNVPYGDKTKEELLKLSTNIIKFLENKNVDIIIIACGTVSSNIYEELKQITNIPIYNIISETIKYVENKKYENILLMATSATVNSHVFKNNLNNITELACPKLVPLIENKNDLELDLQVKEYLLKTNKIDAIILGCTHYPIIKDIIKKNTTNEIELIDMGEVLAKSLKLQPTNSGLELYFSKKDYKLEENIKTILGDLC